MGYKEMYYHLAEKVSDAVKMLQPTIQTTEEMYLEGENATLFSYPSPKTTQTNKTITLRG